MKSLRSLAWGQFVFGLFVLGSVGCGESSVPVTTDAAVDGSNPADGGLSDAVLSDANDGGSVPEGLFVRVYQDEGADDRTRRLNGFDDDDVPLVDRTVRALRADETVEVVTDAMGIARFDELPAGTYLFDSGESAATSKNVAPNLVRAVDSGSIKVVTFGDSLPVFGGSPRFDAVLTSHLSEVAEVESLNLAVSGTTTVDWAVGSATYNTLVPEIADTDLFVVSLGGNDFLNYVQGVFSSGGMQGVIDALGGEAQAEALAINERALVIINAIREVNPDADFAFLQYPNYPASTNWQTLIRDATGDLADTAISLVTNEFNAIMRRLVDRLTTEDLVLVDLLRQTREEPIDPFLVDELHFTEYGHRRVAEEIFLSLGGVVVGGSDELFQSYEVGTP